VVGCCRLQVKSLQCGRNYRVLAPASRMDNDSQMRMSSLIEAASIFRMTLARWSFTVTSLIPRSKATCLLTRPLAVAAERLFDPRGLEVDCVEVMDSRLRAMTMPTFDRSIDGQRRHLFRIQRTAEGKVRSPIDVNMLRSA
jgi:hypothetical protein